MKLTHYLNNIGVKTGASFKSGASLMVSTAFLACASLAMLTACSDEVNVPQPQPTYTVGEADNAIVLSAGISEGGSGVQTRAGSEGAHVPFSATTQMRLYVGGTWTRKTNPTITHYTNCTTLAANSKYDGETEGANDIHPLGSYTPQLYWDDYGTADPGNTENRAKGLAVYGVAVEGMSTLPDDLKSIEGVSWTSLTWNVATDGNDVMKKDIVVSNNHGDNSSSDKSGIKFNDRNDASKNILEYKHMMSKVTFVLTASDGFADGKFTTTPEVVLTRNLYNETSKSEYCFTTGTINIMTATATGSNTNTVKLQDLSTTEGVVKEHALIYPGSNFGDSDADVIARINADGNIYYVTAEKIRAALTTKYGSEEVNRFKTRSGFNYIIKVNVKKTKIDVTATIKNWEDVESAEVNPVINVDQVYGSTDNNFDKDQFSFYRSTSLYDGYSKEFSSNTANYFAAEAIVTKSGSDWNFSTPLYWNDHNTHYQMRGVWPTTVTTDVTTSPRVKNSGTNTGYQVIEVNNVAFKAGTFPSDLAIGRPDVGTDAECTNQEPNHTRTNLYTGGICATEGKINLAFEYMMSQVEVILSTTDGSDKVTLTNAKVEVTNLFTSGEIKLGDREAFTTGSANDYELTQVSGTGNENKRHNAIVPQPLTYSTPGATANVRFKITIYKDGDTSKGIDDIYYADVAPIKEKDKETKIAPNGKWERGKHYVYNLKLSKTKINVTATFTDWVTVTAEDNIWF